MPEDVNWEPFPPDPRTEEYLAFLQTLREKYDDMISTLRLPPHFFGVDEPMKIKPPPSEPMRNFAPVTRQCFKDHCGFDPG